MISINLLLSRMIQVLIQASLGVFAVLMLMTPVHAERIKDLANIQGIRENQLIGYGLVVGLEGTGDSTTQVPLTLQTTISMLQQMGITMPAGTLDKMVLKNVAAVMVTTSLPPFAQAGQTVDVTVSSMANAKSIKGGTLLMTPLKGADGLTYAIAQGNVLVAGAGASANGSSTQINQLSVGRISGGATIEKTVPNNIALQEIITLELKESDFSTASLVVKEINRAFNQDISFAQDARVINVRPNNMDGNRVGFLAALESLNVNRARAGAKVILNARTGSIVLNQSVTLENCAVAHGNLSVVISTAPVISQPNAFSNGRTVEAKTSQISINQDPGNVIQLGAGTSLSEVVRALNAVGATPQDLQAILQAIKAAGSLRAELEII